MVKTMVKQNAEAYLRKAIHTLASIHAYLKDAQCQTTKELGTIAVTSVSSMNQQPPPSHRNLT